MPLQVHSLVRKVIVKYLKYYLGEKNAKYIFSFSLPEICFEKENDFATISKKLCHCQCSLFL
jgi:hypothetical protein